MKRRIEYISKGSTIDTITGYLIPTSFNGNIVYCDEYIVQEDGEPILTGERRLTLSEIAHIMHDTDGYNKTVFWTD